MDFLFFFIGLVAAVGAVIYLQQSIRKNYKGD